MHRSLAALSIGFMVILSGCESQDAIDQRNLRRHFNLSEETVLLEYVGYPATVGFGQREGLTIQAVFQLSDAQVQEIVQGNRTGWQALPIPPETLAKLPYNTEDRVQIDIPFSASEGYFFCRTAGDRVLTAASDQTYPCDNHPGVLSCSEYVPMEEAKHSDKCQYRFNDQILGVLDLQDNKLYTLIGSTY